MASMAFVNLEEGERGGPPPAVSAVVDPTRETQTFDRDLRAAIGWARERAEYVSVRVGGRAWSAGSETDEDEPPITEADIVAAQTRIDREVARFVAESTTATGPERWYIAVLRPGTDGALDSAEESVRRIPAVVNLERRRTRRDVVWVIEVRARSAHEVELVEADIARDLWPDERIAREFEEGSVMFSSGDQQQIGRMEILDLCDVL